MNDDDRARIEALERRVDALIYRLTECENCVRNLQAARQPLLEQARNQLLWEAFLAAMQGDWASGDDVMDPEDYLEAAREALKVWEGRDGQA